MNRKGTKTERRRGPGRRERQAAVVDSRDALIDAARSEFALHGFRGTTMRRVAGRAGVTPAMVHYHFRDKRGLYHAVLEATMGPLMHHLEVLAVRGEEGSLHEALAGYMRMLAGSPELPALLMRDVLSSDGVMREVFIHEFAAKGASAMREILARDLAGGELRDDLDPRLALLSLISMAVFPFIARPVAQELLGLEYDDDMIDRLAAHTVALFNDGVRRGRKT